MINLAVANSREFDIEFGRLMGAIGAQQVKLDPTNSEFTIVFNGVSPVQIKRDDVYGLREQEDILERVHAHVMARMDEDNEKRRQAGEELINLEPMA